MRILTTTLLAAMLASSAIAETSLETVIATHGDVEVSYGELMALKGQLPAEYDDIPAADLLPQLVDQVVVQKILSARAEDSAKLAIAETAASRTVRVNAVIKAHVAEKLTEDYLKAQYDELIGNAPVRTEWQAAHILLETEDDASAAKARADAGEDFAALAAELSTGPSGPNGGDLGWFGAGQMVPEFETAVAEMETGAISGPIETQFGWHIIKLNETREEEKPSFEEVEAQLTEFAEQRLIEELITSAAGETQTIIADNIDPEILNEEY